MKRITKNKRTELEISRPASKTLIEKLDYNPELNNLGNKLLKYNSFKLHEFDNKTALIDYWTSPKGKNIQFQYLNNFYLNN